MRSIVFFRLAIGLLSVSAGISWADGNPASVALKVLSSHSKLISEENFAEDLRKSIDFLEPVAGKCKPEDSLRRWIVWHVSKLSIEMLHCGTDDLVHLQLYPRRMRGYLAAVVSIGGNHGQSQEFEFFWLDEAYQINGNGKGPSAKQLGMHGARWNDFIVSHKFPTDRNFSAYMAISDGGDIALYPYTWMAPEWETRKVAKSIYYSWDGVKFRRHVKKANDG